MDLKQFLLFLYRSTYSTFEDFFDLLPNASLKNLRFVVDNELAPAILARLFRHVYLSAHKRDLDVFIWICNASHIAIHVREIRWDDTSYDPWIISPSKYGNRVRFIKTFSDSESSFQNIALASRFWLGEKELFKRNKRENLDVLTFQNALINLPCLSRITVFARSKMTNLTAEAYWQFFQTPRWREWRDKSYSPYLIDPYRFHTMVFETIQGEGNRPLLIVANTTNTYPNNSVMLHISHLIIRQIDHAPTAPSSNNNNNSSTIRPRFCSTAELDDSDTLPNRAKISPGNESPVTLHEIEIKCNVDLTTTSVTGRLNGSRQSHVSLAFKLYNDTLQQLTLTHMHLDHFVTWLIEPQFLLAFQSCTKLKKLILKSCSVESLQEFISVLIENIKTLVEVQLVEVELVDVEMKPPTSTTWSESLRTIRKLGWKWTRFELSKCLRYEECFDSGGEMDHHVVKRYSAPGADLASWLNGARIECPLIVID